MEDCIFCKIIANELPSKTIYEDELIRIILNINPNTNGHLLALPKKHISNILELDEELTIHILNVIKEKVYPLLKDKLNAKGMTLVQNNEHGQEIKHYHVHIIPRYEKDNLEFDFNKSSLQNIDDIYSSLIK